ncbi:GNAT family N-acetyltransferase [Plantibacter sp. YIM 135347]|jgi:RimJ/RimL family protein N-acetyltransferase|uniref:GNAT family N-acetyltransferase n=1 Tax=Plantibacter sp. YIM 135347 TaxID=3423919 RepID=UPI003D3443C5
MIELRALTEADVEAHNAGEDDEIVRWLTGGYGTTTTTTRHFVLLADNAARGAGKRGFGIWLRGRLAGYIDFDPDSIEVPVPGDVNLAYSVHPWARGRGVASTAVSLLCDQLSAQGIGSRAIIRTERNNHASAAVARRSGFRHLDQDESATSRRHDTAPMSFDIYARSL